MVLVRVAALSTAVLSTGNARDRPGIELWLLGGWVGSRRSGTPSGRWARALLAPTVPSATGAHRARRSPASEAALHGSAAWRSEPERSLKAAVRPASSMAVVAA